MASTKTSDVYSVPLSEWKIYGRGRLCNADKRAESPAVAYHDQLRLFGKRGRAETGFFRRATRGDVRLPHMGVNFVVSARFARQPVGDAPDPAPLAGDIEEDLDRGVAADGRFVNDVDEDDADALLVDFDAPGLSPFASAAAGGALRRYKLNLLGRDGRPRLDAAWFRGWSCTPSRRRPPLGLAYGHHHDPSRRCRHSSTALQYLAGKKLGE